MNTTFAMRPIGVIRSPFTDKERTPIQPPRSQATGRVDDQPHGIFATRYPCRPNQIGLSIVRLAARDSSTLTVEGIDVLDGTPLLDIKPYVPEFDHRDADRVGWYSRRSKA
jgi:tRNA (Thr-GGU) A37 N-methylase